MPKETIRSLQDLPGEKPVPKRRAPYWDATGLPYRMSRLLAFIAHYQATHRGETPHRETMATEMEDTLEAISYWLNKLEAEDRIHIVSRHPLRIMVRSAAPDLVQARHIDDSVRLKPQEWQTTTPVQRYEAADNRRMALARFIGEYRQKTGRGPSYQEMMDFVVTKNAGIVQSMIDNLIQRKLVTKTNDSRSVTLTEEGKIVLNIKDRNDVETKTTTEATPAKQEEQSFGDKITAAYAYMKDYAAKNKGRCPTMGEVSAKFYPNATHPTASAYLFSKLVDQGLIKKAKGRFKMAKPVDDAVPHEQLLRSLEKARATKAERWDRKVKDAYAYAVEKMQRDGRAPTLEDFKDRFYPNASHRSSAGKLVSALCERGLLTKGAHRGNKGRLIVNDENGKPMPVEKKTRPVFVRKPRPDGAEPKRRPMVEQAKRVARFVHEYRQKWGVAPDHIEIRAAIHTDPTKAMDMAQEMGLLVRKPRIYRSAQLTEKGLELLGLNKPMSPEAMPEPSVAQAMELPAPEAATVPHQQVAPMADSVKEWPGPIVADERPRPAFEPVEPIKRIDTADLVLELIERGYVVKRS